MRAAAGQSDLAPAQAEMADAGLKAMVPFERPFLDYLLHNLAESGISRACIVIGPSHETVRDYYERMPTRRLTLQFAIQPAPRGTADAVLAAGAFIGEDAVLVVNGDNLYPVTSCRALAEHGAPAVAAFSRAGLLADGLISPERIQKFAVVIARNGWLERVIEKPDAAMLAAFGEDVYVSMNSWVVPPRCEPSCLGCPSRREGSSSCRSRCRRLLIRACLSVCFRRTSPCSISRTAATLPRSSRGSAAARSCCERSSRGTCCQGWDERRKPDALRARIRVGPDRLDGDAGARPGSTLALRARTNRSARQAYRLCRRRDAYVRGRAGCVRRLLGPPRWTRPHRGHDGHGEPSSSRSHRTSPSRWAIGQTIR